MADVHNKKTRSYHKSMIRSKDTPARPAGGKLEIMDRKFLFKSSNYSGYSTTGKSGKTRYCDRNGRYVGYLRDK